MTSLGIFYVRPDHAEVASRRLRRAGVGAHEDRVGSDIWRAAAVFTVVDEQVQSAAEALRELRT